VETAAMEATGVYWEPAWNLLEDRLKLMLVNARHIKQVPGRKTDVKDCQWIAELLEHGLLKPSFVPPPPQRDLRDLTRQRKRQRKQLLGDRARVVNRIHKTPETCSIKLGSVATDITGKSGRAILDAPAEGKQTPEQMAELVHHRVEAKKPALREALGGPRHRPPPVHAPDAVEADRPPGRDGRVVRRAGRGGGEPFGAGGGQAAGRGP
jgi:transposase